MEIILILTQMVTLAVLILALPIAIAVSWGRKYMPLEDRDADERRAIANAACAAMENGTFYGHSKEVVADARREFAARKDAAQ